MASSGSHEPTRGVEEPPAQRLGLCLGPAAVEAEQLEPAHQVGRHHDVRHPGAVRLEVGEGEGQEPRVLQALDVLLDVRVGAHGLVEFDRVAVLVGVVAPVAVLELGEQAVLGAGVQRLAAHDEPGALGPLAQVDELGQLGHRRPFAGAPVLVQRRLPDLLEADGVEDRAVDLGI